LVIDLEQVVEDNACDAEHLTFELALVLLEMPADRPLVIDLSNHGIGDAWVVDNVVRFDELIVTVESAQLTTRHQLRNDVLYEYPALEIHAHSLAEEEVELRCLHIGFSFEDRQNTSGGSRGCIATGSSFISYTMLGEPVPQGEPVTFTAIPTEFIVMGDLILTEPWRLSWNANDDG
jgi:hypothetical protein